MGSAKGSALEWAMALLHAPGERHALRQKPLPEGIAALLGIAAGAMPAELAEAARTFGEPEARIREAAQFYVREVLFFPQADAYRVLGVDAHAGAGTIKAHHRLLQHWLHPDRLQSEDDAIFASRVNVAWNRLRNPERRQAYDRALQQEQAPEVFAAADGVAGRHGWITDDELPRSPWRHRLPMLALTAACVLLVVLVLRDTEAMQDGWDGPSGPAAGGEAGDVAEISVPAPVHSVMPAAPVVAPSTRAEPARSLVDAIAEKHPAIAAAPSVPAVETMLSPSPSTRRPDPAARALTLSATRSASAIQPAVAAYTPAVSPIVRPVPVRAVPESAKESAPVMQVASTASIPPVLPSYARIQQAWAAGDQLLHFMEDAGRPPPPIWNSPGIQSSADRLRQDMHGGGRVRLSGTQWQIGAQSAVLRAGYVVQGSGTGHLTADLVWREDRWLVVGLSIERAQ